METGVTLFLEEKFQRGFDATISVLDAETSALGAETSALGAALSVLAWSFRQYRRLWSWYKSADV